MAMSRICDPASVTRYIVAEAYDATGGRLSEVRLTGVNVYDFTAGILAHVTKRPAASAASGTRAVTAVSTTTSLQGGPINVLSDYT
jgi:hypothetical protein